MKTQDPARERRRKLLRKFHTLCRLCGLTDEERRALVGGYGFGSSADMPPHLLQDACEALRRRMERASGAAGSAQAMDKLRKRCLKALCAYLDSKGIAPADKLEYARRIACRAARRSDFNRLTAAQLRALTGYFNQERETVENAVREAAWEALLRTLPPQGEA